MVQAVSKIIIASHRTANESNHSSIFGEDSGMEIEQVARPREVIDNTWFKTLVAAKGDPEVDVRTFTVWRK